MAKPSVTYRAARRLRQFGWIFLIGLIVFLGTLAWSASQIRPKASDIGPSHETLLDNGTLLLTAALNVSNPGPFAVDPVEFSTSVFSPNGTLLVAARSPTTSLPGGGTGSVPIRLYIALPTLSAASYLLTQDAKLPALSHVNATIGEVVSVKVVYQGNVSWGAPFYGLAFAVGSPAPGPGNTTVTNVTVSFDNHAAFDISGILRLTLQSSSGVTCGSTDLPVNASSHASYQNTVGVTLASKCDPRGGSLLLAYVGPSYVISLPPQKVP